MRLRLFSLFDRTIISDPYREKYRPRNQESLLDGKYVLPDRNKIDIAHIRKDPILKDNARSPGLEP